MPVILTPSSPATGDLISNDTAIQNATLSALNASDPSYLARLISAASVAIEGYCMRSFTAQSYTEVYSGGGMPYAEIQLNNFPVLSIERIATSAQQALTINNTSAANQRATVATTSTGLKLVRVASGVSTTSTLAFASYLTLDLLVAAINGLGNGWSATAVTGYGSFPSADLLPIQGAGTTVQNSGGAYLELYTEENSGHWRLSAKSGILSGEWPQGDQNIRIDYTAGFDPIPQDVQEACVQYVQDLYEGGLINSNVKSATLGPFSYTMADKVQPFTGTITTLLGRYRDYAKQQMNFGS